MKKAMIAFAAFLAAQSGAAGAAAIGCYGTVRRVELRNDGLVIGDWGFGQISLCYLNADTASPTTVVKKESCGAIYSSFLTALASHQTMQAYISTSQTCAQALAITPGNWPAVQPYGYEISGG